MKGLGNHRLARWLLAGAMAALAGLLVVACAPAAAPTPTPTKAPAAPTPAPKAAQLYAGSEDCQAATVRETLTRT